MKATVQPVGVSNFSWKIDKRASAHTKWQKGALYDAGSKSSVHHLLRTLGSG